MCCCVVVLHVDNLQLNGQMRQPLRNLQCSLQVASGTHATWRAYSREQAHDQDGSFALNVVMVTSSFRIGSQLDGHLSPLLQHGSNALPGRQCDMVVSRAFADFA